MGSVCLSETKAMRSLFIALLLLCVATPGAPARTYRSGQAAPANDLSVCLSDKAPPEAVVAACTRVIGLNRFSGQQLAALLDHRGTAYAREGDAAPAIADLTAVIRLVPDYPQTYYTRGIMYAGQNDLKSALADFLEFRRLAPNDPRGPSIVAEIQQKLAAAEEQTRRLAQKSSAEISALQQRLSDAGCYRGAIDGQPSQAFGDAVKACPSQEPVLRIETGTHTARIDRISADAQCRILATTSDDKTTRIWSAADGRLLRILRVPIDAANGGKGHAVALSPDGHYVAAAGHDATQVDAHFIYVFDVSTGALVARPFGFTDVVKYLVFSPDGRWLAAVGGSNQSGVRVYDTADWHVAMSDLSYHQEDVYAVDFGPDGALYVAGLDRTLRRYGAGPRFAKERMVPLQGGAQAFSIAADPRGEFVTVGFEDSPRAAFFDAKTLRFRFQTDASSTDPRQTGNGDLVRVAWSNDGGRLYAGGYYAVLEKGHQIQPLVIFDRSGHRIDRTTSGTDDSIYSLTACGSGMALSSGSGFGLFDQAGTLRWWPSAAVNMHGKFGSAFTIAPDAKQIRFGLGVPDGSTPINSIPIVDPVMFDLARGTLSGAPQLLPGFIPPDTTTLPIEHWLNQPNPTLAGRPLALYKADTARALAIRPHGDGFVLGTAFMLRGYARDGSERWELPSPSDVSGLNISADGGVVVSANDDGTIRWYRWSDGKELLALFVNKADRRWVAWTPAGYYMASPGGEDLIGWHVNRGWNQAAEFFPASRFRARFNRPDIVRLVLDTLDEDAAIKQANAAAGRTEDAQPLIAHLPPLIRVLDPVGGAHVPDGHATIGYTFRSPSGSPVERIVVTVNGRPVKEVGLPVRPLSGDEETKGNVSVTLGERESDIGLIAWSGEVASQAAHVDVVWDGAPATNAAQRRLYALVVGVGDYADADMKLTYAAKDARDFAKALENQQGLYYGAVQTRVLTDRGVTRASMSEGLAWLKTMATSPDDVSILFLAGHGLTDAKGTYWFFPADANADTMSAKGISQEAMRQAMQDLKGKVLWFLDTCHAGAAAKRAPVDINVLLNTVTAAENGGIVVFASSSGRQLSVESKDLGNGAFTKALVEGIAQGKAVSFDGQKVTTSSLDGFVEQTVSQLTNGQQTPVMERPPQEHDFTIAVVRK